MSSENSDSGGEAPPSSFGAYSGRGGQPPIREVVVSWSTSELQRMHTPVRSPDKPLDAHDLQLTVDSEATDQPDNEGSPSGQADELEKLLIAKVGAEEAAREHFDREEAEVAAGRQPTQTQDEINAALRREVTILEYNTAQLQHQLASGQPVEPTLLAQIADGIIRVTVITVIGGLVGGPMLAAATHTLVGERIIEATVASFVASASTEVAVMATSHEQDVGTEPQVGGSARRSIAEQESTEEDEQQGYWQTGLHRHIKSK